MDVSINNLTKKFGNVTAVNNFSLEIKSGEFVAFLGPSGCGKTTTLLTVAGIYKPNAGTIFFGGKDVTYAQPKDRNIGMVFQSYALYPHMSVYENIVFSMKLKKASEEDKKKAAQEVADLLGIGHLLERKPGELSGGQQQRVALGRALVKKPQLLLFDEPLSNLDARLRISMRTEIKRIQKELGITCIYVTHDQIEAMTMADKVAVLKDGLLQTFQPPIELHTHPCTEFIGSFVGNPPMNLFNSKVVEKDGDIFTVLPDKSLMKVNKIIDPKVYNKELRVGIRPEDIEIVEKDTADSSTGIVSLFEPLGRDNLVNVRCGNKTIQLLSSPKAGIKIGDTINFKAVDTQWQFFDLDSGKSLLWHTK